MEKEETRRRKRICEQKAGVKVQSVTAGKCNKQHIKGDNRRFYPLHQSCQSLCIPSFLRRFPVTSLEECGKSKKKNFLLTLFLLHPHFVRCLHYPAFPTFSLFVFTYNTQHKQQRCLRDSNPQSQQAIDRRPST